MTFIKAKVIPIGLFRNNTFKVRISLNPLGWKVSRTFEDFRWLHNCLNCRLPANYIVELPEIKANEESKEADVFLLHSYLTHIVNSPDLLYAPELVDFLKLNEKDLPKAKEVQWV